MTKLFLIAVLVAFTHPPIQTQNDVFPAFDDVAGAPPFDAFREGWYSKHLNAMSEARLPDGPGETYRFLWLRSFDNPIVVRVSCVVKKCDLIARRIDGQGGYEPGSVVERKSRTLSDRDSAKVFGLVGEAKFWQRQPSDARIGLDGSQWIVEGMRDGSYHVWDVWSPESSGTYVTFRELCLEMLRLSGIRVAPAQVY